MWRQTAHSLEMLCADMLMSEVREVFEDISAKAQGHLHVLLFICHGWMSLLESHKEFSGTKKMICNPDKCFAISKAGWTICLHR